ncbi:MAG TPA: hypothetical protein IAA54_07930 [Candidatus Gallacutalibacter pullicola]|uniref:Uncharacterized protein n=1 Tax=Candidatus Gallacutalibacter pullicola TaxID=2840830 RepID=A0A9D1DR66_9FIRM|nr:hypothetical protein [Candidatus Gallacutalibacter pullicola]
MEARSLKTLRRLFRILRRQKQVFFLLKKLSR